MTYWCSYTRDTQRFHEPTDYKTFQKNLNKTTSVCLFAFDTPGSTNGETKRDELTNKKKFLLYIIDTAYFTQPLYWEKQERHSNNNINK